MTKCEICGVTCADDAKAFGRHLWDTHEITPNDYRLRYLSLPPKCANPSCKKPVAPRVGGGWHKCCSPFCAIEMGEDIPEPSTAVQTALPSAALELAWVPPLVDRAETIAYVSGTLPDTYAGIMGFLEARYPPQNGYVYRKSECWVTLRRGLVWSYFVEVSGISRPGEFPKVKVFLRRNEPPLATVVSGAAAFVVTALVLGGFLLAAINNPSWWTVFYWSLGLSVALLIVLFNAFYLLAVGPQIIAAVTEEQVYLNKEADLVHELRRFLVPGFDKRFEGLLAPLNLQEAAAVSEFTQRLARHRGALSSGYRDYVELSRDVRKERIVLGELLPLLEHVAQEHGMMLHYVTPDDVAAWTACQEYRSLHHRDDRQMFQPAKVWLSRPSYKEYPSYMLSDKCFILDLDSTDTQAPYDMSEFNHFLKMSDALIIYVHQKGRPQAMSMSKQVRRPPD